MICKENSAWNPSTCLCKCDKDCEIGEYLENYTSIKNLCEVVDMPESASINAIDKNVTNTTNYWLLSIVLLAIMDLLLLIVLVINCY